MYAHGDERAEVLRTASCRWSRAPRGIDDFEWGVTLFAVHPDDLKEVVYTMRFDEASLALRRVRPVLHGHGRPLPEVLAAVGLG